MPSADPGARVGTVSPADVERWFTDLDLEPIDRAERDGIASWDLVLDGRRRFDLRVTVILDPSLGVICWAHFAPPITDMFRKSYRKLLRWNDEFPFAKFSVGDDERPLLAVELPAEALEALEALEARAARDVLEATAAAGQLPRGADALGTALARILGIADRLLDDTKDWLWLGGRMPDQSGRTRRNETLLDRFAPLLPDLFATNPDPAAAADQDADPTPDPGPNP
jgi:hypothetical protein